MYYTVYKTTNKVNGKFYIGAHKTEDLHDQYLGSGVALKRAIIKYGVSNFSKVILYVFDTPEDMFLMESKLVDHLDSNSYNLVPGGKGGWDYWNMNNESPLKNPKIREKLVKTRIANGGYSHKKFIDSVTKNLTKAIEVNTGKSKPNHSKFMSESQSLLWRVVDPNGNEYNVNGLKKFCIDNNLPYSTMASKSTRGKVIKTGKAKGWIVYDVE